MASHGCACQDFLLIHERLAFSCHPYDFRMIRGLETGTGAPNGRFQSLLGNAAQAPEQLKNKGKRAHSQVPKALRVRIFSIHER